MKAAEFLARWLIFRFWVFVSFSVDIFGFLFSQVLRKIKFNRIGVEDLSGSFTIEDIENLTSGCPLLEKFTFTNVGDLMGFAIHAPNLKRLILNGDFSNLNLEHSPFLDVLRVDFRAEAWESNALMKVPVTYDRLKFIDLQGINYEERNAVLYVLHLILHSPNLQELEIGATPFESSHDKAVDLDFWGKECPPDFTFKHLKFVEMFGLPNKSWVEFLKFVLGRSPVLEVMRVSPHVDYNEKMNMANEVLHFRLAVSSGFGFLLTSWWIFSVFSSLRFCVRSSLIGLVLRILGCPLLEKFTFTNVGDPMGFAIHGPNLKHLILNGDFSNLNLEHSPFLDVLRVDFRAEVWESNVLMKVPVTYDRLKFIDLQGINYEEGNAVLYVLHLILHSPNLQELEIGATQFESSHDKAVDLDFWEKECPTDFTFKHLKLVEMCGLPNKSCVEFLKFVLGCSPVLEVMRVSLDEAYDGKMNMANELLHFQRVEAELYSSKADSWKHVQVPETLKALRASSKVVNAKPGILYMTSGKDIIAFDLHKEVFRLYTIPPCNKSDILEFNGEAAMVFKSDDGSALSLFVLNDVCGEVFWTKLLDLEFDDNISRVLPSLATAKFVTENDNEAKKYALRFHGDGKGMVIKYTESLVYLQGFQRQVESNRYLKQ
ncbi:hypothetical protein ACET3Z_016801 [Daucus carota]